LKRDISSPLTPLPSINLTTPSQSKPTNLTTTPREAITNATINHNLNDICKDNSIINEETIHNLNNFTPNLAIVSRCEITSEDKVAKNQSESLIKSPIKFVVKDTDSNTYDDITPLIPIPYPESKYVPVILKKDRTLLDANESNKTTKDTTPEISLLHRRSLKLIKQMLDTKKNRYLDGEDDSHDGGNVTYYDGKL
jgi:hypothetical protein